MLKISVLLLATILTTLAAPSVAKEEKETIFICNPYANSSYFQKLGLRIPMFEKPIVSSTRIALIPNKSTVEVGPGHEAELDPAGTIWISIYYNGKLGYINKIFYTNETCLKRSRQ